MNTALLIILLSFVSLTGAAVLGGAIGVAALRLGRWLRQRPQPRVVGPRKRESLP